MNEGFPQHFENKESGIEWHELKHEATRRAESMLQEVGFEHQTPSEQLATLDMLLGSLESNNENRFVYRVLSLRREQVILTMEYTSRIQQIESSIAA